MSFQKFGKPYKGGGGADSDCQVRDHETKLGKMARR